MSLANKTDFIQPTLPESNIYSGLDLPASKEFHQNLLKTFRLPVAQ